MSMTSSFSSQKCSVSTWLSDFSNCPCNRNTSLTSATSLRNLLFPSGAKIMILPSCLRLANNGSCIVVQASTNSSYNDNVREKPSFGLKESYAQISHGGTSSRITNAQKAPASVQHTTASTTSIIKEVAKAASLSIAVIGATGELAKGKIFPALFALYHSGFLPENVSIFGYSRKNLSDEDLRSIIASTLTCRIDHHENCDDHITNFLKRTHYVNGGYDNIEGMSKLSSQMQHYEGLNEANRIFYLSVPQESLLDVASSLADHGQTKRGWNRIIIEKPFGFDLLSSDQFTQFIRSKYEENQLYRIDHLLGRNTIENLTVLKFSNLVFMPLWNRSYIHNVQVIWSDDFGRHAQSRYVDGNGIIGDVVHSHILQTIALLAMEPPISLDGEDVRNEKCIRLALRSGFDSSAGQGFEVNQKLEPSDVIIGRCNADAGDSSNSDLKDLAPTYFAAALYIDNARWDGVPFLIKAGRGLQEHRVEIRVQFRHVPGNIYLKNSLPANLATNELILRDSPEEAILVKINNKIPGLSMDLDASELNLLYKDKYNIEVSDSYEQLLHDVIDGDNHLFMRSDEVAAAWNILSPVLNEMEKKNISTELYELGSRGPDKAIYLWAKHGVRWLDD